MERRVLAQITFGPWREDADEEWLREMDNSFNEFMTCLRRSGHVMESAPYGVIDGELRCFMRLTRADSLERKHFSAHSLEALAKLASVLGSEPSMVVLDQGDPKACNGHWQEAPWLVIYGSSWECNPPVRDHQLRPIPTYLLPLDPRQCEDLSRWEDQNDNMFSVWVDSSSLENEAYRALADPLSDLNVEARELARVVEEATGKPVYAEIYRYYMLPGDAESNRPCPLCGSAWRVEGERVDCRCEPCRIICSLGNTEDEDDLASIGTWRGPSSA